MNDMENKRLCDSDQWRLQSGLIYIGMLEKASLRVNIWGLNEKSAM